MKGLYFGLAFILLATMIISPLRVLDYSKTPTDTDTPLSQLDYFLVKSSDKGEIDELSEKEYIIGVLAGEMSPDNLDEALKAQAVAAYSYALYMREKRLSSGGEFDLTDSPDTDQKYLSKTERVALWQDSFDKNEGRLEEIFEAVKGEYISFGGKPILALYHSVSSGKTENCSNVFGGVYPYLCSVESSYDLLSPDYLTVISYDSKEFAEKALNLNITLVGEPTDWIREPERSETGNVLSYTLAGHKFKGTEMRSAFSLPSSNFDLVYENGKFKFTVRGHGHGVGMSQYGASHMAKLGSGYADILALYYPGTIITRK